MLVLIYTFSGIVVPLIQFVYLIATAHEVGPVRQATMSGADRSGTGADSTIVSITVGQSCKVAELSESTKKSASVSTTMRDFFTFGDAFGNQNHDAFEHTNSHSLEKVQKEKWKSPLQPVKQKRDLFARWVPSLAMPIEVTPRLVHKMMEGCMLDLAVLLTFGLSCPLLGLIIAVKQVHY